MHSRKLLTPVILLVSLITACESSTKKTLEANKALVNHFTVTLNAGNWDALNDLLTESFQRHCQATPDVTVNSRDEFIELQKSFAFTMPDQNVAIEMLVAEGDYVAAYATYTGTQTGAMGPFPPTGKPIESKFLSIFRIERGRIAELWVEFDNLAILSQLGLFPPPPPEPAEESSTDGRAG